MRTLRLSLVGTVMLVLLGGLSMAVMAQGDEGSEPAAITPVTGTLIGSEIDDSDEEYSVGEDGVTHARGARHAETYEWDDERLPPVKRMVLDFDMYPQAGTGGVVVYRSTVRLDGPDGSWTGTGQYFGPVDGSHLTAGVYAGSQEVLVGQGAYEGLTAILGCAPITGCAGYIVAGELPPLPDPVEPAAE